MRRDDVAFQLTAKEKVMNEEIVIELGEVSEETKGTGQVDFEGDIPNSLR